MAPASFVVLALLAVGCTLSVHAVRRPPPPPSTRSPPPPRAPPPAPKGQPPPKATTTCSQVAADGSTPAALANQFRTPVPVEGFYQWENNNGYCGETSLLQSGLALGQWISQFNARTIASTFSPASIAQTGKSGSGIDFYSQMLLDDYATASKANLFGSAAKNLRLNAKAFNSAGQATGVAGSKAFLAWVKAEVVAGNYVTIGASETGSEDPPYAHIVNVIGVDSNSPRSSSTYDGTDVMWIDDHGAYPFASAAANSDWMDNPAIPPGAGPTPGCTPFKYGYTFDAWPKGVSATKLFQIQPPTSRYKNYGVSISGVIDTANVTLPVSLSMVTANPRHPIIGYRYEAPMIGTSITGDSYTNTAPAAMSINFTVTVRGLTAGVAYNLYLYKTTTSPLPSGPLKIPTSNFNAQASLASQVTAFTAVGATFTASITAKSTDTLAYRCVPASAP